jgi:hypothetical protein
LRSDYNSLSIQNPIDPLKTGGDTASDYLWKAAEIGGALILGILVFTIGGRGSECSNKVGGFSHPVELAKCLWRNPPPVGPVPVSPPVASPETHKIGLEAPVLLGAAVAVKAAPSLWAGAWETLSWLGQGSVDVAGGLLSGAARITIPIVIIPDDDPYFGNPAPGKYWGPQPSNQVWY